ncbi:membrane protein [Clostridium lundense]|uniref:membrane protein n=1 Tax=Clostridium lundense TaxID=319475 RepID=UPI0004808A18|nr:membrane protein [Clostridium lundense]
MNYSVIGAFTIILIVLTAGEIISMKTKAFIPSVFVSAVLFLIGFWTFMPKDIIAKGSFQTPIVYTSMYLLLVHMGTLMNLKELLSQWRTVLMALAGILGICIMTLTIGKVLFGWQTVVAATPPLTGGVVASILMSKAAADKGLTSIAVLATCMYIMQGFIGYPISAFCLKKEAKRVLGIYKNGGKKADLAKSEVACELAEPRKKLLPPLPEEYQTPYVILLKLGFVGWIASKVGPIVHINDFVLCLILGVIACEIGFLEEKALNKANSFGFLMTVLMAFIFANLSQATPSMLKQIAIPLFGIIILGVIGMYVISLILAKTLGFSKHMAFACTLTALYGFPADYILTHEAIKSVCETKEERDYVIEDMLPKMLVAGFTTVTIASVIIAGFFVKLL